MKAHLSLKLRRFKLTRNRKGLSSIIGGIFMVLIAISLSSSYFVWSLSQNTVYNDAIRQINQVDSNHLSESVTVQNTTYSVVSANLVSVAAQVQNQGSLSIQLVTLWVRISNGAWSSYNFTSPLNMNVSAGAPYQFNVNIQIPGAIVGQVYSFASWLITARGNVVALQKQVSSNIIVAQLAQGIGSMALDFSTFRFFTYATPTRLANYPDGTKSFTVPGQATPIAFGATLTNLDPREQTITLNQYSNIWLILPGAAGQIVQFFIVTVASDGTITTPYSPITIAFGETKLIVYASSSSSSFAQSSISASLTPNPGAVNLLLLGTIGPRDYGQNIPFVAVYVYKP